MQQHLPQGWFSMRTDRETAYPDHQSFVVVRLVVGDGYNAAAVAK
jgi:hypothetical protein